MKKLVFYRNAFPDYKAELPTLCSDRLGTFWMITKILQVQLHKQAKKKFKALLGNLERDFYLLGNHDKGLKMPG